MTTMPRILSRAQSRRGFFIFLVLLYLCGTGAHLRRFLEKIFPYDTPTDDTLAFLTPNPFVRCSSVHACPTPALSPVPHARTESR